MKTLRTSTRTRLAAGAAIATLALGASACESDSAGPEAGGVTTDDLTQLQDQVGALEERVGVLEDEFAAGAGADAGVGTEDPAAAEGQQQDIIGQEVTVSAEITELITTGDAGTAFRVGGDSGPSVAVLSGSASPDQELQANDVVQISGTVQMINRDSFEQDFGVAEGDLFDDPESFFSEFEGQPAIAADSVEVLQEQAPDAN